jgi:hypothetical protein
MSHANGFTRPGLACESCGEPFSLFLGVPNLRKVEGLPDPFEARCPLCDHQTTYPRSAIGVLVAAGSQ